MLGGKQLHRTAPWRLKSRLPMKPSEESCLLRPRFGNSSWAKLGELKAEFMEDNQAAMKACKAGGSQKLMHLPRTHRIDAAAVAEQLARGIVDLVYTPTEDQAADIRTKRFEQPPS